MKKNIFFYSWPLWAQITSFLLLLYIIIIIAMSKYVHNIGENFLSETIKENQNNISNTVSSIAIEAIITEDVANLETIINELLSSNPSIYSIKILNEEKEKLVNSSNEKIVKEEYLYKHTAPITYEDEIFGYINLVWDLSKQSNSIQAHLKETTLFTSSMLVFLGIATLLMLHKLIIQPMNNIERRLLGHVAGKSENIDNMKSSREFNQLCNTITKLESLTISKNELQKEVSVRKKAQYELAKARDEALKASRAKSTFLANMSHELRTPLNAILGYSEIIAEDAEENNHETYLKDAEKINNAGKHLLELISNILDLSKIEAGKMSLSITTINITNMVNLIRETITPSINKNNNLLSIDISEDIVEIKNDEIKLKQIILNLLSNACKFTHNGEISLKAQRYVLEGTYWITISVTDTGIGISNDYLEKIFHSFSQADESTSRKYGGTGLGLDISQKFCWLMGGELKVSSQQGKGSHFWIQIPEVINSESKIKIERLSKEKAPDLTPEQIRFDELQQTNTNNKRKKICHILLFEQDLEQQEILNIFFKTEGFNLEVKPDLSTSLEKLLAQPPSAIIINTEISKEKALDLLKKISKNEILKKIPVIMLVKNIQATQFIMAGARTQLPLQFELNDLVNTIKQTVRN